MNDHEISRYFLINGNGKEWGVFRNYLKSLPPESAWVLLREMGHRLPLDADPCHAIQNEADVLGKIIAGAALMVRATRIRGFDTADRVKPESWQSYSHCREQAEQILRSALEIQPQNGLAAAWYAATAVDSNDSIKQRADDILREAVFVPLSGFSKLLSCRTEKWGGSHEEMWEVARRYSVVNTPWSGALIAKAHYEQWLYLELMDERPLAEYEAGQYLRNEAVLDELFSISATLNSSQSDDHFEDVFAHDVLAAVFSAAGKRRIAADHLRKAGKFGDPALLTGGPWWQRSINRLMIGLPPW